MKKSEIKILNEIAINIKKLRMQKHISQLDFYNDTNIHIARIEQGRKNISIITLIKICKYFNVSPAEILDNPDIFKM